MTYDLKLDWHDFNVDLNTIDVWLKANAGDRYCGMSADSSLRIHFTSQPDFDDAVAVEGYWMSLDNNSTAATAYKSENERIAEAAALIASAKTKLANLGLTSDEIKALLG